MIAPMLRMTGLLAFLLVSCAQPPGEEIVARVDGEKITSRELAVAVRQESSSWEPEALKGVEARKGLEKRVLESLIEEKIFLNEVQRRGLHLSTGERKKALERLKSGYGKGDFEEALREQGTSEGEWEQKQEEKLLIERLAEQILEDQKPTEKEIATEYAAHRNRYEEPEKVHCRQIVTASRAKAEKILSLLKKGENFAAMAQQHSESPDREKGGDLGFVARGELPPIMDDACFRIKPGETSGVVISSYGFHIFRTIERTPARTLTLAEARPLIEKRWREERREKALTEWMEKEKKRIKIEVTLP